MSSIQQNIEHITSQIADAQQKCGRAPDSVQLLAVSKTKPVEAILEAANGGQIQFGENYVQEGADKVDYFQEHHPELPLIWHFIGPIQSNKSRLVAERFDWVHTIDREKIAKRLNDQRPDSKERLQVLIQVNISNEASKSGVSSVSQMLDLAGFIATQGSLNLRGLMAIPEATDNKAEQLATFKQLQDWQSQLKNKFPQVDTLSMGMSGDMESAIEAGSTMVRIGTAIFGARDYSK